MEIQEAYKCVFDNKYEEIEAAIKDGLDVNITDGVRRPMAEFATFGVINYRMLYILWKAGAKETTPRLEEVFLEFKNGKTYQDLESSKPKKKVLTSDLKYEIEDFKLKNVPIKSVEFQIKDGTLKIEFEPFMLEEDYISREIEFQIYEFLSKAELKKGKQLEKDVITDSILLLNCHNPVDLTYIKLNKKLLGKDVLDIIIDVDFEYERTGLDNEQIEIQVQI